RTTSTSAIRGKLSVRSTRTFVSDLRNISVAAVNGPSDRRKGSVTTGNSNASGCCTCRAGRRPLSAHACDQPLPGEPHVGNYACPVRRGGRPRCFGIAPPLLYRQCLRVRGEPTP